MNKQFIDWFQGSIAIDEKGNPQKFYHGSVENFTHFDLNKIRADETDAVYNGFWFTTDRDSASPAWRNPRYMKTCYLRLCRPASNELAEQVYWNVRSNFEAYQHLKPRSYMDAVRFELARSGYDGVIHRDKPLVNLRELDSTGRTSYKTIKGVIYHLAYDLVNGGLNLYDHRNEFITGYLDYNDFISLHSERVFVVFDPRQIYVLDTEKVK